MMHYRFYEDLSSADYYLITEGLKLYRELLLDSAGDIDILGVWDANPLLGIVEREVSAMMAINDIGERVRSHHSLNTDQITGIYNMLIDAIEQYDVTGGEVGLLDGRFAREQANNICRVIRNAVPELQNK